MVAVFYQRRRRSRLGSGGSPDHHRRCTSLESIPECKTLEVEITRSCSSGSPTSVLRMDRSKNYILDFESLVLVNKERRKRNLPLFVRSDFLTSLAQTQVMAMAQSGSVVHSVGTIQELMLLLSSESVAENIQRGDSLAMMHMETMKEHTINRANLLSKHFNEFGSAVAMGPDGKLYSCQLFRRAN